MGSRGDCFDNAVAESFFATLKKELIHRRAWPTKAELQHRGLRLHRGLLQPPPTALARSGCSRPPDFENSTLSDPGAGLAASRLASTNKIKFTAPTIDAIA